MIIHYISIIYTKLKQLSIFQKRQHSDFQHNFHIFVPNQAFINIMNFRTVIPIKKSNLKIGYQSRILSLGSCFAVNIFEKLDYYKFRAESNPFGILFHPLAIEKVVIKALKNDFFTKDDFFQHNNLWHCFDFHSELSQNNLQDIQKVANQKLTELNHILKQSHFLFITLGTAWVYEHHQKGIVANCHKVPQTDFSKRLLSVKEIETSLQNIIEQAENINPNLKIVFTVSPVRHLKDGFSENQLSKAHLISSVHSVLANNPNCEYFPSYEIMMDELRDYRFYADDMLHPSSFAINYIWQRFVETFIGEEFLDDMKEIDSIQKGLQHKPFNTENEQFKKFKIHLDAQIKNIKEKFKTYDYLLEF